MDDDYSMELLNRYRQGDQQAAYELFDRYTCRLMALARTRLSAQLARRIDPEDVVQSVYRSFFRSLTSDALSCQRSGDLWRLLAAITLNKLRMQARRHTSGVRDVRHDVSISLDQLGVCFAADRISKEPQPAEAVEISELLESIMQPLTLSQRKMLELRLQNYRIDEIAVATTCSERTVRRLLHKVKQELNVELRTNDVPK